MRSLAVPAVPAVRASHVTTETREREPAYQLLSEAAMDLRPAGQRFASGWATLDAATRGGLLAGRVVVLAGAPGAGKTTAAVQLAMALEQHGCAVAVVAFDEPAEGLVTRAGQALGHSRESLESGGSEGKAARDAFAWDCRGRAITIVDPDRDERLSTVEDAAAALDDMAERGAEGRPRVLVVDSLQTARCRAAAGAESTRERIDATLRTLRGIAKQGVLVIVTSEMARGGYRTGDRGIDVSALASGKESGSIEYGASLLLGLRTVKDEPGMVDVEVAKNRLGPAKPEFRLKLDHPSATFAEVERPAASAKQPAGAGIASAKDRVRKAVQANGANAKLTSHRKVLENCAGSRSSNHAAIKELEQQGELVLQDGVYRLVKEPNAAST